MDMDDETSLTNGQRSPCETAEPTARQVRNRAVAAKSRTKITKAEQDLQILERNMRQRHEHLLRQERELSNEIISSQVRNAEARPLLPRD